MYTFCVFLLVEQIFLSFIGGQLRSESNCRWTIDDDAYGVDDVGDVDNTTQQAGNIASKRVSYAGPGRAGHLTRRLFLLPLHFERNLTQASQTFDRPAVDYVTGGLWFSRSMACSLTAE